MRPTPGSVVRARRIEGEESSRNAFDTSAAPNQQAFPAAEYLMSKNGGEARRRNLLGTDYVYPRATNKILREFLISGGSIDHVHADKRVIEVHLGR